MAKKLSGTELGFRGAAAVMRLLMARTPATPVFIDRHVPRRCSPIRRPEKGRAD
jgi:hypothetical protein